MSENKRIKGGCRVLAWLLAAVLLAGCGAEAPVSTGVTTQPVTQAAAPSTEPPTEPTTEPEKQLISIRAEELEALFPQYDSRTNRYLTIYAPTLDWLNPEPAVQMDTLPVYRVPREPTEAEFRAFVEEYQVLAEKLYEIPHGECEYTIDRYSTGRLKMEAVRKTEEKRLMFGANPWTGTFYFTSVYFEHPRERVQGEFVSVHCEDSDDQILKKLEPVIRWYEEYFGMKIAGSAISREYNYHQLKQINVSLYEMGSVGYPAAVTREEPCKRWLELQFNTAGSQQSYDWEGSVEEAFLTVSRLRQSYAPAELYGEGRMLPLEEAEAMLEKGWVFGFHMCSLCMEKQEAVDFSQYDRVALEYVVPYGDGPVMPFYAFYKQLSARDSGIQTFAKTYVPAIQVEGLEEYFAAQEEEHK